MKSGFMWRKSRTGSSHRRRIMVALSTSSIIRNRTKALASSTGRSSSERRHALLEIGYIEISGEAVAHDSGGTEGKDEEDTKATLESAAVSAAAEI